MKSFSAIRLLTSAATLLSLCACTLPVPKTSISYNPALRTLDIRSPKDVKIGKLELMSEGTNFTLTVDQYASENNIEVVRAAVAAQAQQQAAGQEALAKVLAAAAAAK